MTLLPLRRVLDKREYSMIQYGTYGILCASREGEEMHQGLIGFLRVRASGSLFLSDGSGEKEWEAEIISPTSLPGPGAYAFALKQRSGRNKDISCFLRGEAGWRLYVYRTDGKLISLGQIAVCPELRQVFEELETRAGRLA